MPGKTILVTGGAGYIGSHVVRQLGEANEKVVVLDDLSTGFRQAVLHGDLVVGNTGDHRALEQVFGSYDIDTVMHFAAHTIVPESVADPLKYYRNNTCASRTLLEQSLRQSLVMSQGSLAIFLTRPVSAVLLLLTTLFQVRFGLAPLTRISIDVATERRVTPAQATSAWRSMSPEQASAPLPPVAGCSPAATSAAARRTCWRIFMAGIRVGRAECE